MGFHDSMIPAVSAKRVAIFQVPFGSCGRTVVMRSFIAALNRQGIIPDVHAERFFDRGDEFFASRIEFRPKKLKFHFPEELDGLNILGLNARMRRIYRDYDLVINSNNTSILIPQDARTLTYIHTPYAVRWTQEEAQRYLRQATGSVLRRVAHGAYVHTMRAVMKREKLNLSASQRVVCNSKHTRRRIVDAFGLDAAANPIDVLYPPVDLESFRSQNDQRENRVVTLGRFGKSQLEQIEIARQVPDLHFDLIGAVEDPAYYDRCRQRVAELGLDNVSLHRNLPFDELKPILRRARFFLNNKRDEPFGISTVESIAAGCIPVVHDSAGPRETVPRPELRFSEDRGAAEILRAHKDADLRETRVELQEHVEQFGEPAFAESAQQLLAELL